MKAELASSTRSRTVAGYMAFNFVSAVLIVFVNKVLFNTFHFRYSTVVTACHFFATFVGTVLALAMGIFERKRLNQLDVLPITLAFCGFVVFNNLSLSLNSVGFYQLMKVLTTPVIVVLQLLVYGVSQDKRLTIALVPVVLGVTLATVNDVSFNVEGTVAAVAGILSTSFYQLFVKTKQQNLKCNSWQLLLYQAPQATIVVTVLAPFVDNVWGGFQYSMSNNGVSLQTYMSNDPDADVAMLVLFASCCLAFCVNLSIFLVVGATSPVAYNVLGHFKLLVILTGGLLFFNGDSNPLRILGMILAFGGVVWYTHLKQNIANAWDETNKKIEV